MNCDAYSSEEGSEGWNDLDENLQGSEGPAISFFDGGTFPSIEAAIQADYEKFGFNFATFRKQVQLDDIETIMCINYIRSQVAAGVDILPVLAQTAAEGSRPWKHDCFMRPVLEADAFLLHDWSDEEADVDMLARGGPSLSNQETSTSNDRLTTLLQENEVLKSTVHCLAQYLPDEALPEALQVLEDQSLGLGDQLKRLAVRNETPSPSGREGKDMSPLLVQKSSASFRRQQIAAADAHYFDGYSQFGIHKEMLSDKIRTEAYRSALEGNPSLVQGAAVLDVGCGTGILSMFAARGGAKHVTGVDGSATMSDFAQQNCMANHLHESQGGPMTVIAGRLEELSRLPVEKVDVIVSEWMGYALLYETMLDTVLYARDRWLKPGGAILPDCASLYLAGVSEEPLGLPFWRDVYGFSMAPVARRVWESSHSKAIVAEAKGSHVLTTTAVLKQFDLMTMHAADADFSSIFSVQAREEVGREGVTVWAAVLWFDVEFSARVCKERPGTLTTSPFSSPTHWAQTILPLREPIHLQSDAGVTATLEGRVSIARSKVHRSLDISLEYFVAGSQAEEIAGSKPATTVCSYTIAMS